MWLDVVLVVLGVGVLIAIMAFVMNPPEFWVKRAFLGKRKKAGNSKDSDAR